MVGGITYYPPRQALGPPRRNDSSAAPLFQIQIASPRHALTGRRNHPGTHPGASFL